MKANSNKTGVSNDPLGQNHSHASNGHCFVLLYSEKWKRTDGRTDDRCENNDPYQP